MNIQELLGGTTQTQNTRGKGQKELGQQDFLKLLVAQMKNQDPSNPADNGQFLSQIAQFSMVDGIERLGNSVEGISGNVQRGQGIAAAQLVGREVLTESDSAVLQPGAQLQGRVAVPDMAQGLNIQIRDISGRLIRTLDTAGFGEGVWDIEWNGMNEQGEAAAPGEYVVQATALVEGKQQALPVQMYNTVESVTLNRMNDEVALHLANNQTITLQQVSKYR
jgi:flagellar basal-body rod modification protein FlgD